MFTQFIVARVFNGELSLLFIWIVLHYKNTFKKSCQRIKITKYCGFKFFFFFLHVLVWVHIHPDSQKISLTLNTYTYTYPHKISCFVILQFSGEFFGLQCKPLHSLLTVFLRFQNLFFIFQLIQHQSVKFSFQKWYFKSIKI